jgi:starch phosphorylase
MCTDHAFLSRAVEDLRYQHTYHPVPIEEKCPALAHVLNQVSAGLFGDAHVYEPLLNTIRQGDHYLLSDDFDSCEQQRTPLALPAVLTIR